MAEITQEERNTLRYYGERAESAQGEILAKAANDADRLARAEALLREARGWCPQGESRGGIGYAVKPPNGVRERIDAFLSDD